MPRAGSDMRVVHLVCSDGFAGVERYIANTALGLAARALDVTVIGGEEERMRDALADTGVEWLPGDDVWQTFASLRSTRVHDIIHSHMSEADLVGAVYRLSPSRRAVTHVSTRHFMGARGGSPITRAALRLTADRSIRHELAISAAVAEFATADCDIVYTGVESSDVARPRERFVLVAQRLEPEKATADAIEAWAVSAAPTQGWTMRIAGDGSERARLEQLVRERGVDGSVEFIGHRDDIPELLDRAGLVFAPTPREGLGILVLEAMAHGAPIVASAGGGHLETVGAVTPELLFAPGDATDGARAIDALVADAGERERVGAALRRFQREHFTIERQVAEIHAAYERLLAQ